MMMASSSPSVNDSLQTTCCPMVPAATSVLTCSGASLDSAPGGTGVTTAVPPLSQPGQPAPSQPRKQPPSSSMASTLRPPTAPEQLGNNGVRCPRCDSPNTKFCYYNNYSLAQPRHFCKTCRRYWTRGGALRNVPVGGGCRKNKGSKSKSSSASSATGGASAPSSLGAATGLFTSYSASSSSVDHNARGGADPKMDYFEQAAGCRGLSFVVPQVASSNLALQLGMSGTLAFANNSRLFSPVAASNGYFDGFFSGNGNHHEFFLPTASNAAAITSSPQEKPTSPVGATSVIGFSYPLPLPPTTETGRGCVSTSSTSLTNSDSHMSSGAGGHHSQLASSIESLSIINQDLHWRLQQQRLAMLYGAGGDGTTSMPYDGELVAPQQPAYLYEIARQHQATTTTATTCTLPFQTSAPDADDGGSKQTVITAADHQLHVSPGGYGTSGNDVWYLHGSGIGGNSNSNSDGNSNGWGTIAASAHPWSELHHQFGAVP